MSTVKWEKSRADVSVFLAGGPSGNVLLAGKKCCEFEVFLWSENDHMLKYIEVCLALRKL